MTRGTSVLAVLVVMVGVVLGTVPHSDAQPPSATRAPAVLEEATRLTALVEEMYDEAKFQAAIPLAERSLALRAQILGPRHPDVAESLCNMALLYKSQGLYAKAEPLFIWALDIDEKALGSMHPTVALDLTNLASLYESQGSYPKAEMLRVRARAIRDGTVGAEHLDLAQRLHDLAMLYYEQDAYATAEPLWVRTHAIRDGAPRQHVHKRKMHGQ